MSDRPNHDHASPAYSSVLRPESAPARAVVALAVVPVVGLLALASPEAATLAAAALVGAAVHAAL